MEIKYETVKDDIKCLFVNSQIVHFSHKLIILGCFKFMILSGTHKLQVTT